jgi:FKBP-type peptidyl-prolyl cis-trans isomerase 2
LQGIDNLVVGMELQSQDEQGNSLIVRVTAINKDSVKGFLFWKPL